MSIVAPSNRGLREDALAILKAGILAASPSRIIPATVQWEEGTLRVCGQAYPINGRIFVVGTGKAAGTMARELEKRIPPAEITDGVVLTNNPTSTEKIRIVKSTHPLPSESGVIGCEEISRVLTQLRAGDILLCLISGGGSSLLADIAPGISLDDLSAFTDVLVRSGAKTAELNILRKHISTLKGGGLALRAQPATVISLIISDALEPEDDVASGPTVPDRSTFKDAMRIIREHDLVDKIPRSILSHLTAGERGAMNEKASRDAPFWRNVHNHVIADIHISMDAMAQEAGKRGYSPHIVHDVITGTSERGARAVAEQLSRARHASTLPRALVFGSETTIKASGGEGGRNQELVARLIPAISKQGRALAASVDSDGIDFIPGISGAWCDNETLARCKSEGIDLPRHLVEHTTSILHRQLGTLIELGPTGTNVGDIGVILVAEDEEKRI